MNNLPIDNLRTEIAVLQEDADSKDPGVCKFKIPVTMLNDVAASYATDNSNLLNRRSGTLNTSVINMDNTIDLEIPPYLTYFSDTDTIPKGTKFIVTFVGGNINDPRIIGIYDQLEGSDD